MIFCYMNQEKEIEIEYVGFMWIRTENAFAMTQVPNAFLNYNSSN